MGSSAISSATSVMGSPGDRTIMPVHFNQGFNGFSRNKIINGNFDIWQRGSEFITPDSGTFTADRWNVEYDGTIGTFLIQKKNFILDENFTATFLGLPLEVENFLYWNQTDGGSGSTKRWLMQKIESVRSFANNSAAVSFWAKADSNRTIDVFFIQNYGTEGSSEDILGGTSFQLTDTWQFFTNVFSVPFGEGKTINSENCLKLVFALPLNTTMNIFLTLVQAEVNNFSSYEDPPIGYTLDRCRRYFQKHGIAKDITDLAFEMFKEPTETEDLPYYLYDAEIET